MELHKEAREFYRLQIATETSDGTPIELDEWQASFDNGGTWHDSQIVEWDGQDWAAWLVAGPNADSTGAVAVIRDTPSKNPIVRVTDSPEVVVRDGPTISLT